MISLLAIIGLFFILWWVSRVLRKFGNFCDKIAEHFLSEPPMRLPRYRKEKNHDEEEPDEIDENEKDIEYNKRIRKEINNLLGE